MYRIACQRIAREAYPGDVSGAQSRGLCRGEAGAETAAEGRLRALAEQRDETVDALDRMFLPRLESELQRLMVGILPLYDPPGEQLPAQTRELAALLSRLRADEAAIGALGRMGARRGMRTTSLQLGPVAPMLGYPELSTLTREGLASLASGGAAHDAFADVQSALALELATLTPSEDPPGETTLDLTRSLLGTARTEFDGGRVVFVAERDARGLPRPASLAMNGFVDGDGDGLADVNEEGRFVDASGAELSLPTPFALALEAQTDVTERDAMGRALGEGGSPIFATRALDGSMLAGLLRESRPFFEGATPVAEDVALALGAQLGGDADATRVYGSLSHTYRGFDTANAPLLDLLHAASSMLDEPEMRDTLTLSATLLADHEPALAAVLDAGLRADEIGDEFPDAALRTENEFWDDVLNVMEDVAQRPGMMDALLRALADPRSDRLGQILAEMARHFDRVNLPSGDAGRAAPPFRNQEWNRPVNRDRPDDGDNQSLLQQTLSIMHELNGAQFCNKQDAHMIIEVPVLGRTDLMDSALLRTFGLQLEPFDRCELLRLDNTTEAYILAIQGPPRSGAADQRRAAWFPDDAHGHRRRARHFVADDGRHPSGQQRYRGADHDADAGGDEPSRLRLVERVPSGDARAPCDGRWRPRDDEASGAGALQLGARVSLL